MRAAGQIIGTTILNEIRWATSPDRTSDEVVGRRPLSARLLSVLLRPTAPPLTVGIMVAASFIVAETLLVSLLMKIVPEMAFGVIFLLGVLVVSAGWGFGLAVSMTLASALIYTFFHLDADGSILPITAEDWVAIIIFLPIALLANVLAGQARLRAAEANQRRREAEASRDELRVLAEQQAALRRVATLVARGVPPSQVFSAVADELGRVLGVSHSTLIRYEPDGASIRMAVSDEPGLDGMQVGETFPNDGESVATMVFRTSVPARMDSHENAPGYAAARVRDVGLRSGVGVPIVVGRRVWGAAIVGSSRPEPLPPSTEARVGDFADLVATAIANAATRAELTASRARIVVAADEARRRFERNLHDGAQQRLVSLGLALRTAEASVPAEQGVLQAQLAAIVRGLTGVSEDLQEISRGIHPAILSRGGLGPALKTLARRSTVPVVLQLSLDQRLPEPVEVAAYYVVSEALTNAAKHAQASEVNVDAEAGGAYLLISIRDDGIGGADLVKGSGLIGLRDRVEALGGHMEIESPAGSGTSLVVKIPLEIG
jgi:signal transduction histidine kinase